MRWVAPEPWDRARCAVGMDGFDFHDLRHTGNTLAAGTGASTKELMARMGHASARAALTYQHASEERDVVIADRLSEMTKEALGALRIDRSPTNHDAVRLVPNETAEDGRRCGRS